MKLLSPDQRVALHPLLAAADPLVRALLEQRWNDCVVVISQNVDASPWTRVELKSDCLQTFEAALEENANDEVSKNVIECLRRPQQAGRVWVILSTPVDGDDDVSDLTICECSLNGQERGLLQ